jgi:hypothetical protein
MGENHWIPLVRCASTFIRLCVLCLPAAVTNRHFDGLLKFCIVSWKIMAISVILVGFWWDCCLPPMDC